MIQQPKDWQALRAEMRDNALAFLEANPSADEARATILDVMNELANATPDAAQGDFDQGRVLTAMATRLRQRGLSEWADALEERSDTAQGPEPTGYAVEMLIGRAAGLSCGAAPSERRFTFVRSLREAVAFESADFVAAAEPILKSDAGTIRALAAMLLERAAAAQSEPQRLAFFFKQDLAQLSSEQTGETRFIEVWDDPYSRGAVWIHDLDAYELLRRVDCDAYLNLLEGLPLRSIVYQLLDIADGWATISELCLLLKNASPVFDSNGEWIKERRVAFIVLNLLAGRLFAQPFEEGQPSESFKETLAAIIDVLSARPDAIPLGYAWLQRVLMSPGQTRRRASTRDERSLSAALVFVAEKLAAHLGPHPSPLKWIEAEFYVWRSWRVYALLALEICRQPVNQSAIGGLIADVLLNDIASSVLIERLGDGPNIGRVIVSQAIAQIPNPAAWFAALWKRLFWQRDRFRFSRVHDPSLPNTGQVAALWAICGLELLGDSDEGRSLWLVLYDAVRESIRTAAFRQHNDAWSVALRFLAALWPKVFPHEPPAGTRGSLEDLVLPWKAIDVSFAQLVVILDRYGVQPEQLRRIGVSGDMLHKIIEESHVMGQTLLGREEIAAIGAVAEKLSGHQGQPPS